MPVKGFESTARNLAALARRVPDAADEFLRAEAGRIKERSRELVPRDTDELYLSAHIVSVGGNMFQGVRRSVQERNALGQYTGRGYAVRYGGTDDGAEEYAIVVHEHPSEFDPPTWRGKEVHFSTGGPKFLERAFNESRGDIESRMAAHLQSRIAATPMAHE